MRNGNNNLSVVERTTYHQTPNGVNKQPVWRLSVASLCEYNSIPCLRPTVGKALNISTMLQVLNIDT
jgi:hypothetical protein